MEHGSCHHLLLLLGNQVTYRLLLLLVFQRIYLAHELMTLLSR